MRIAQALVLVSLLVTPALGASPEASVASAQKTLETARATLAKAVQRIEVDPPSTADLDAAHAAVGALKDAIDAGAEQEQKDLDYAKAALAARKELRTQREYVDQRRAKVHIFNQRRVIDAALADFKTRAATVDGKEPAQKDFDDARAAGAALKKAADEARQFASQDAKFATYLADIDATLVRQSKAIDERWVLLQGDKHRALVEESRKALSDAMAPLGNKGATDAQFSAADAAATALAKRLEEGKALEGNEKYRAFAAQTRTELAASKKKMDEQWSETGLARLKAEIEPAYKDLQAAAKGVRARKPSDDQLAEARTAAIVVRKLVEKFQPEATRSAAFGQYVSGVKDTLVEVEVQLQLRSLDAARSELTRTLRGIEGKEATNAQFDEANGAVQALEKLLETVHKKDAAMVAPAADARQALKDAKAALTKRMSEFGVDRLKEEIDPAYKDLQAAAKVVRSRKPTAEQLAEARTAATVVRKLVEKFQPQAEANAAFGRYVGGVTVTLAAVDVQLQLRDLDAARAEILRTLAVLEGAAPTDAQFADANGAVAALEKLLEGVNKKDADLAAPAADARQALKDAKSVLSKRRAQVDLDRLKAEIDPAYKDLQAAAKAVRARKPTEEQLAEARTASTVVRKLAEKLQPEGTRNATFGLYLGKVQDTLADLDVQLALRGLDGAKADLVRVLRFIEGQSPTDDHFAEGNSALLVLEKTLEAVNKKDEAMIAPAADARQLVRDAKLTLAKRRIEVDVDRQKAKVEDARNVATTRLAALNPPTREGIQAVEDAIKAISSALEAGTELTKKSRDYAAYDREVTKRVGDFNGKVAAKKVALAALDGRAVLTETITTAKAKLDVAKQPSSTDADLEAAVKALDAAGQAIDSQMPLEQQDRAYGAHSDRARNDYFRMQEALELARQARDLRKRTGDALAAGAAAADAGAASQDLRKQKAAYDKALPLFKGCKDEGASLLNSNPALAKVVVLLDGRNSTATEVVALCGQRAEATAKLIKPLVALIAFDDGPKKSFEKAKALMAQGNKKEALAQYDECTATGMTVAHRNPELKERAFEVAGVQMTLGELIKQCSAQSRALLGK